MDESNKPDRQPADLAGSAEPPVYRPVQANVQPKPRVELSPNQQFVQEQVGNPDKVKPPRFRSSMWQSFFGFFGVVQLLVAALLLALVINQFVFQSYQVYGESMSPTLHEGDRLIVSKLGRTWASITRDDYLPARGDIVVFTSPIEPGQQLVKRVVGLPGETVEVKNGSITVYNIDNPKGFNPDELVDAEFASFTPGEKTVTVEANHVFVSGDNRSPNGSLDSRNDLGLVPIDDIAGTLAMRIFPLSDAAFY
jgi:signal peptidase I